MKIDINRKMSLENIRMRQGSTKIYMQKWAPKTSGRHFQNN